MIEETFESTDGLQLFARSWRGDSAPRAIVVIVHGFKAHGGLYEWPASQLIQQGFAVFAIDLRGHGRSGGPRQFVEHATSFVEDVHELVKLARARHPGLPVFVLGHSAGGVISSLYVLEHQRELAGFVCESFAFRVYAPDFALAILKGFSHIAPHAHVLDLKDDYFSRDPAFVARMKSDPLIDHTAYPALTVAEMVRADERLDREFPSMTLPLFILHGTEDKVTKPAGSQRFADTAGSKDMTLKLYQDYAHDLLNDIGKEVVMADIIEWLVTRTPAAAR